MKPRFEREYARKLYQRAQELKYNEAKTREYIFLVAMLLGEGRTLEYADAAAREALRP